MALALKRFGRIEEVNRLVEQAVEDSGDSSLSTYNRAIALSNAAALLTVVNRKREAQSTLMTAITVASEWSRNAIFNLLERNTETLAAIDGGRTLLAVFDLTRQLDSWWQNDRDD